MSKIEVNTVDVQCGSTLTLGSSGKTVTLASGASQSGFGRTGTVDWCTTAKTSPFTSVSGKGYFVNTTSGAVTVTLPASPSAGDIVSIKDYAGTFDTNNVTIGRNGSKINGECGCATLSTEGQSITLVYVDGTKGWQDVQDSTTSLIADQFVSATGGTITTVCTNYKVHTFTSDGTFTVSGGSGAKAFVSYMVVAGGGGGAGRYGGGGGGGGMREGKQNTAALPDSYTAFPNAATSGIPVAPGAYPITVGGGGDRAPSNPSNAEGTPGSNSVFSTITSAGGGRGGGQSGTGCRNGGSGGGGSYGNSGIGVGGTGNTPSVSPPQGFPGGTGTPPVNATSGGGGATEAGQGAVASPAASGRGGAGGTTNIPGSPISKSGGGGGASSTPESITAGAASPCGSGTAGASGPGSPASCAAANSGGGGGGGNYTNPPDSTQSGAGGSGIVVIRYKFQ